MKETITSRQNPRIREVCGLTEKKNRRESGLFRFDGSKLLREAIAASVEIVSVFVRIPMDETAEKLLKEALDASVITEEQIYPVSETVFEKISEEKAPEGILTVASIPTELHCSEDNIPHIDRAEKLLIAESLRDPGNLGTVMRSCAALGIDRLILTADCADLYNPKTVRSAMGALFRLPTLTVKGENLPELIHALRRDGRRV